MPNPEQSSDHFTLVQEPQTGLRFQHLKPLFRRPDREPADNRKNHGYYEH